MIINLDLNVNIEMALYSICALSIFYIIIMFKKNTRTFRSERYCFTLNYSARAIKSF